MIKYIKKINKIPASGFLMGETFELMLHTSDFKV